MTNISESIVRAVLDIYEDERKDNDLIFTVNQDQITVKQRIKEYVQKEYPDIKEECIIDEMNHTVFVEEISSGMSLIRIL